MQTLAKIQVTSIFFLKQDMWRNVLLKFIYLYGDATLVPIRMGTQHGGQKLTETSVTEYCYKSVNLFLEGLKNINIILFLSTNCSESEIPRNKSL